MALDFFVSHGLFWHVALLFGFFATSIVNPSYPFPKTLGCLQRFLFFWAFSLWESNMVQITNISSTLRNLLHWVHLIQRWVCTSIQSLWTLIGMNPDISITAWKTNLSFQFSLFCHFLNSCSFWMQRNKFYNHFPCLFYSSYISYHSILIELFKFMFKICLYFYWTSHILHLRVTYVSPFTKCPDPAPPMDSNSIHFIHSFQNVYWKLHDSTRHWAYLREKSRDQNK